MGIFDCVVTDFGGDDTGTFTKTNSISSLFELKTAAGIGVEATPEASVDVPFVSSSSNGTYLAVSLNDDVTIFSTQNGVEFAVSFAAGLGCVRNLHFIGGSCLLAVVGNGSLRFFHHHFSSDSLIEMDLGDRSEKRYQMSSIVINSTCRLTISSGSGEVFGVSVPFWDDFMNADQENVITAAQKCLGGLGQVHLSSSLGVSNVFTIANGQSILIPSQKGGAIGVVGDNCAYVEVLNRMDSSCVISKNVSNGHYLSILDNQGTLFIIDTIVCAIMDEMSLAKEGEVITDFHILDESPMSLEFDKVAVIVDTEGRTEMHVRSLRTLEVSYSIPVRAGTQLIPAGEGQDRVLFLLEPLDFNDGVTPKNLAYVRELCEALPQACLERMLRRKQFKEAEAFAVQYKLDVQQVHLACMGAYRDELNGSSTDEFLVNFLKVCDRVQDHNMVGEACMVAVTLTENPLHVHQILDYTNKRKITDSDTLLNLNCLKYKFATLRIVLGDQCDVDTGSKLWVQMGREDAVMAVFEGFVDKSRLREARMVYSRHCASIVSQFHMSLEVTADGIKNEETFVMEVFQKLLSAVQKDSSVWRDCVELIEGTILPSLESSTLNTAVPLFCDLCVHLISLIEHTDPTHFPSNSLYVAEALQRFLDATVKAAVTPMKQAEVAFLSASITTGTTEEPSLIDRMAVFVKNLKDIKELKEVYNCPLSYQEFTEKAVNAICYDILDKALSNVSKVKENVDRYARPYMKKHNLPADDTLFGYIKGRSHQMASSDSSTLYDVQCLTIMEAIESSDVRNRAVLEVARRACIPWKAVLQTAVDRTLADRKADKMIVQELRRVCVESSLALMVRMYGLPIGKDHMASYTLTVPVFGRTLSYIMNVSAGDGESGLGLPSIGERLEHVEKIISLYNQLHPSRPVNISVARIKYYDALLRLSQTEDGLSTVVDAISHSEEAGHTEDCDALLDHLIFFNDVDFQMRTEEELSLRLRRFTAIESLITRFRSGIPSYTELSGEVRALRLLQERFSMCESLHFIRDYSSRLTAIHMFIDSNNDVLEVIDFASVLRFSFDEVMCIVFEVNEKITRNAELALTILSRAISCTSSFSQSLATHSVQACEMILLAIHALSEHDTLPELDQMYVLGSVLYRRIPQVVARCAMSLQLQERAIQIWRYLELFVGVFSQATRDDQQADSPKGASQSQSQGEMEIEKEKEKEKGNENNLIYSQSQRTGLYRPSDDGPLFERMESARCIGRVARSVITMPEALDEESLFSLQTDWDDLLNHLNLNSQFLLEFTARVYSAFLPCMSIRLPSLTSYLSPCVRSLCERVIAAHPSDLWTGVGALLTLDEPEIYQLLTGHLRQFALGRKNPQAQINYLRIAQFMTMVTGNSGVKKNLIDQFNRAIWQKRMRKLGVSTIVCKLSAEKALEEFVKVQLDPVVVKDFCESFGSDAKLLLPYAILLLLRASDEKDEKKIAVCTETAQLAIELSTVSTDECFQKLHELSYALCPYNYEVHSAILQILSELDEANPIVEVWGTMLSFLKHYARKNNITKEEYIWYVNRQKKADAVRKAQPPHEIGSSMRAVYSAKKTENSDDTDSSTLSGLFDELENVPLYQRDDLLLEAMPEKALHRLPLHPMLYETKVDLVKNWKPIVAAEVDIYNVKVWQILVRDVPHIKQTGAMARVQLLSDAVIKKANQALQHALWRGAEHHLVGDVLSESDVSLIKGLMSSSQPRSGVINTLSLCFKKMTTCELKLRFLYLGLSVAEEWDKNRGKYNIAEGQELSDLHEHIGRLQVTIVRFETERLLKAEHIFDERTSDLICNPNELIEHIYETRIDWADQTDVGKKQAIITELASITRVNLALIQDSLVKKWLDANASGSTVVADLNDTMGGSSGVVVTSGISTDNDTFTLPIFESAVTRIVYLIRQGDLEKNALLLKQVLSKRSTDSTADGCRKQIVSMCVTLRAYRQEELTIYFNTDLTQLCGRLEQYGYERLFSMANIDISMKMFNSMSDKLPFTKSLLAPNQRQTPEVSVVAASLFVDYCLTDKQIVEQLLNRLHTTRNKEMLSLLLTYSNSSRHLDGDLSTMKNVPLLWARVFEWNVNDIDLSDPSGTRSLRHWLHFLFSCPQAGGRGLESVRSSLMTRHCAQAAHLLPVLSTYTQRLTSSIPDSFNPDLDLAFEWMRK